MIVCKITPDWVVVEGTEGCKGYKDYLVLRFLIWE